MSGSGDTFLKTSLTSDDESPDSTMAAYTRMVGRRLRTVREERLYSLRDVERESDSEFKSSVISAYERGERMMSIQRLDRLAQFYDVPIANLLPNGDLPPESQRPNLTVRLGRLEELEGEPFDRFRTLVADIRDHRQDEHAEVVTLRDDDLYAVASMFDVPADEMADRLTLLDLLA